jgi:hypothetical protein
MTYTINDEWGGGAERPPNMPAPEPTFTISGRPVPPVGSDMPAPPPPPAGATAMSLAQNVIARTNAAYKDHLDGIAADRGLNEQGQRAKLAEFDASPVDQAEALAIAREAEAQADVERQRAALVKPADAAGEQRNLRYRDRLVRDLDHAPSPLAAAQQAVQQATPEQLSVLLEELPSLLTAKGVPTDGWLDHAAAAKVPEYAAAQQKAANAPEQHAHPVLCTAQRRRTRLAGLSA